MRGVPPRGIEQLYVASRGRVGGAYAEGAGDLGAGSIDRYFIGITDSQVSSSYTIQQSSSSISCHKVTGSTYWTSGSYALPQANQPAKLTKAHMYGITASGI
jgi:hypothetical protein